MDVGDKVICKYSIDFFKIGGIYEIEFINSGNIKVGNNYGGYWFNGIVDGYSHLIWDYFYTVKEVRRLKLEKMKL